MEIYERVLIIWYISYIDFTWYEVYGRGDVSNEAELGCLLKDLLVTALRGDEPPWGCDSVAYEYPLRSGISWQRIKLMILS